MIQRHIQLKKKFIWLSPKVLTMIVLEITAHPSIQFDILLFFWAIALFPQHVSITVILPGKSVQRKIEVIEERDYEQFFLSPVIESSLVQGELD